MKSKIVVLGLAVVFAIVGVVLLIAMPANTYPCTEYGHHGEEPITVTMTLNEYNEFKAWHFKTTLARLRAEQKEVNR